MQTLTHRYAPRGAAKELFSSREPEVLMGGPVGTGKTLACLEKLNAMALKTPGFKGLMVRKTLVDLTKSAQATMKKTVLVELIAAGQVAWFGGSAVEPPAWRYANGSSIIVMGLDRAEKLQSLEIDVAFVEEATEITQDVWETLTGRLRNWKHPYQQVIAACNPAHPKHWLKQRCDKGLTKMLYSKHTDNPALYNEDGTLTTNGAPYMAKLDNMSGVKRLRHRDGVWAAAEGAIYTSFDESFHVIPRFDIPKDWPRYWVVDFGFTHPFVCQWWAEDDDGRLFMYREIFMTKRLVEDHAKQMLRLVTRPIVAEERLDKGELGPADDIAKGYRKWTEPEPWAIIADHDAEGRSTLEKYLSMGVTPATKAVTEGIERVESRWMKQADERARLYLMQGSLVEIDLELEDAKAPYSTVQEIPGYIWKPDPKGTGVKEEPLKFQDDGCDCLRYMVAYKDLGPGEPSVRWM